MAARPTAWKYGANSDPSSHFDDGVNEVIPTSTTATIKAPRKTPSAPPRKRSTRRNPDAFITHRAVRPAMPAAMATAKKITRKAALSAAHGDFRYAPNTSPRR